MILHLSTGSYRFLEPKRFLLLDTFVCRNLEVAGMEWKCFLVLAYSCMLTAIEVKYNKGTSSSVLSGGNENIQTSLCSLSSNSFS